jgi:predicted DNA-binding transcriptional regulator AlpA
MGYAVMTKEFLSITDMATKLGVTRETFYNMRERGEVPKPVINSPKRWLASQVEEFYKNRSENFDFEETIRLVAGLIQRQENMTKKEFCKQIIQTVDNCSNIDGMTDDDIAEALGGLLAPLSPKDLKRFSMWGKPEQQTTPDNCW